MERLVTNLIQLLPALACTARIILCIMLPFQQEVRQFQAYPGLFVPHHSVDHELALVLAELPAGSEVSAERVHARHVRPVRNPLPRSTSRSVKIKFTCGTSRCVPRTGTDVLEALGVN